MVRGTSVDMQTLLDEREIALNLSLFAPSASRKCVPLTNIYPRADLMLMAALPRFHA
tara:strand:+ start:34542 stop:34712 length:171 start_codon:yes stop_codon:yes gene_type:complete